MVAVVHKLKRAEAAESLMYQRGHVGACFDAAPYLASLSRGEYAQVRAELRAIHKRDLSVRELDAAVKSMQKASRATKLTMLRYGGRGGGGKGSGGRPSVAVNGRSPSDVARDYITHLAALEDARVFWRGTRLVKLSPDDKGRLIAEDLEADSAMALVDFHVESVRVAVDGDGDEAVQVVAPPREAIACLLKTRDQWAFPPLVRVAAAPFVRPDGTVCDAPGYDQQTGTYYNPDKSLELPALLEAPSQDNARAAARRVLDVFSDFPFVAPEAHRASVLAYMLSILARPMIDGCMPLLAINATGPGVGKSLLASLMLTIATGGAVMTSWPSGDESEARKRLTSELASAPPTIVFDNVRGVVASVTLESILTARTFRDRMLGTNNAPEFPVESAFLMTGNGMRLGGDMFRRAYRIDLDPPRQRGAFRLKNIERYVREHRGELLADLLTIIRAWHLAGRPEAPAAVQLPSFREWGDILAGMLYYAGVPGFLATQAADMAHADEETEQWEPFLTAWHDKWGAAELRINEVALAIETGEAPELADVLPAFLDRELGKQGKGFRVNLGTALSTRDGRRYGERGVRIVRGAKDGHTRTRTWHVEIDAPEPEPTPDAPQDAPERPQGPQARYDGQPWYNAARPDSAASQGLEWACEGDVIRAAGWLVSERVREGFETGGAVVRIAGRGDLEASAFVELLKELYAEGAISKLGALASVLGADSKRVLRQGVQDAR